MRTIEQRIRITKWKLGLHNVEYIHKHGVAHDSMCLPLDYMLNAYFSKTMWKEDVLHHNYQKLSNFFFPFFSILRSFERVRATKSKSEGKLHCSQCITTKPSFIGILNLNLSIVLPFAVGCYSFFILSQIITLNLVLGLGTCVLTRLVFLSYLGIFIFFVNYSVFFSRFLLFVIYLHFPLPEESSEPVSVRTQPSSLFEKYNVIGGIQNYRF